MSRSHSTVAAVVLLAALSASGQETAAEFSGPQPGERLPALKATLVYGDEAGQTVDLVERALGRPTLLVIVSGSNRPAARLTRILMNFAEMQSHELSASVVYLDSDQSAAVKNLKRAVSWWQVGVPVGVSIDGAEGPGSYGLNRNVNLTVLVADKGRVTSNFALVQPSETDAPKILKDVVALAGGRVPTVAEVSFLAIPTHKPPNAPWRTAPSDLKMRRLICAALAAEDASTVRSAVAALEKYVKNNEDRQNALGNVAGSLLERRTRSVVNELPIGPQLRSWRQQYKADH